ncbi:uncharacterized protein LOC131072906 isoform X2 [Cryptomeria japonica]|uniref:uncharacterized protein LOC131072906 isoform X2 n=1 Tax=Cryptomeria japonica TaxID=3369 RepID=UPI0027DAA394|nr:uncharacterized protein LOC131072906 isoform X2 [Cryptomeria japonica]
MSHELAFGLVEENTMNEFAAPYTPSMPFFTLPTSSEPPYSSYPVTSVQSDVSSVYYYDSGYQSYPYCLDFSSSSNPQYDQDWYVDSSVPPVSHDWYSENEDPAISYYPSVPSYDADGYYAYGSCPYPEQLHLDPLTSSTVITTTPWENCTPASTVAGTDFCGSLQSTSCGFYGGCENKDDKQNQKLQEVDSSRASRGYYLQETQRGKITESSKELNFKRPNSACQESASTIVEVANSNNMPTCPDFEGFSPISRQKDFGSTNAQGSFYGKPQQSHEILQPFGWTASFPSDMPMPKTNISSSELLSSVSDPILNWTASFSDDTPMSRSKVSISRPMVSASYSLENSFSTLFSNYKKYENPILLSPQSTAERASTGVQESKGKCRDAKEMKLNTDNIENKLPVSEDSSIPEISFGCSIKPRKVIDSTATAKQSIHALNFDTNHMSSASPSFYNDPSNRVIQLDDMPLMDDMMYNDISLFQGMDFHTRRMEDFLANCSKGGESGDDALLTPKSNGQENFPFQVASFACSKDQFNPILDIISSDCHPPKQNPSSLMPLTESASSLPTTRFVEGSPSHGVIGSSKPPQTSLTQMGSLVSAPELLSESNGPEETKPCQSIPLVIDGAASVESNQVSAGDSASTLSKNMNLSDDLSSSSEEAVDTGKECHKLIHTLHNLSVVLLASSSSLVNMRESDIQVLQSVICNLSQCMVKGMCLSTSIDGTALEPEEPVITPNVKRTQKACKLGRCHSRVDDVVEFPSHELRTFVASSSVGGKEVPVDRTNASQISVEAMQLQMTNFETYLELMKLEIRCLKMELEMERLRKNYKGALKFGNEANKKALNSAISPDMNLGIKENVLTHIVVPTSQATVHGLPDLNLNPIKDSAVQIDATMNLNIKGNDLNHTVMPISQDSVHGLLDLNLNSIRDSAGQTDATILSQNEGPKESIPKSSLSTSDQKIWLPNVETRTGQIEDASGSKVNSDDEKVQCTNDSSPPESKDTSQVNGQHKMCEESILKSSLSTSDQNILQPNKEARTGQIEDPSGCKVNSDDGKIQCTIKCTFPETKDTISSWLNGEQEVCSIVPASLEVGPYRTDGPQLKSNRSSFPETKDVSWLNGRREVCSIIPASLEAGSYCAGSPHLENNNHLHYLQRSILYQNFPRERDYLGKAISFTKQRETESQNSEGNNFFIDNMCQAGNIFLEGGATIESSGGSTSAICFCGSENVNGTDISKEASCSESDWENINSKEADYIYFSDEESM